ncbi:MAG TPA: hypothetical protein VFF30_10440 [Nitrososphaerales archaeon]|nr:hypothetical protein [Nitrososphaerales archaeon]
MKSGTGRNVPRWIQNLFALFLVVLAAVGLDLFYFGDLVDPPIFSDALTASIIYAVVIAGIPCLSAIAFVVWPSGDENIHQAIPSQSR